MLLQYQITVLYFNPNSGNTMQDDRIRYELFAPACLAT
jgi:hypothetical protein